MTQLTNPPLGVDPAHKTARERPILFNGAMVRAVLAGTKTQTRRAVKATRGRPIEFLGGGGRNGADWNNSECWGYEWADGPAFVTLRVDPSDRYSHGYPCPYGRPGDRLWVRETFAKIPGQTLPWIETDYKATYRHGDRLGDTLGIKKRWTPSIHMPRAASRINLEVTEVRVERLQDISEADAQAEGSDRRDPVWPIPACPDRGTHRAGFEALWESINGPGSWDANPWMWAVSFKRI